MLVYPQAQCRPFFIAACLFASGCASVPPTPPPLATSVQPPLPQVHGSYYQVQPGETLWRIAHDFGLDAHALARANRLSSPTQVKVGQRLFIPSTGDSSRFFWPARGHLSYGSGGRNYTGRRGLEIRASAGSFVRASRTGRVAVATNRLHGWGKAVILDHGDGYLTVYAGLEQLLVSPGMDVEQGNPLGRLGQDPLYFEIRYGTRPSDPLRLLP
ncbi:MAG: peptidoglycan DD-metalloendopeptidase family protein [Candidatus Omnitrophica bacterium]|nr:peptidoglycan DD-metalloendopeptidase family protein [Candidatus Omnitrophota bacterium]